MRKRDGRIVPFDQDRITSAISRAMSATREGSAEAAEKVSEQVIGSLMKSYPAGHVPAIEEIQDVVETQLILMDFQKTAKAYILYRNERSQLRENKKEIPEYVKKLAAASKHYFHNQLAEFVYYRTYANWIPEEGRRETWIETVERYMSFMKENLGDKLTDAEYAEIQDAILHQEAMPSMRLLQFAGTAARATNVCAYNCSFTAPQKLEDFAEIMYISMCGTGAGFSVESQNVQKLPQIKRQSSKTGKKVRTHVVADSKEGWADALTLGLRTWFDGKDVEFDLSELRPAGARLKTMGGKSSGPEPLRSLLAFARAKILSKQGRRLSNIDVHDICCKIGEVVVAGGVRRSAMISLSDLDDAEMQAAKTGQFYFADPQRSMANNSAVYTRKPDAEQFMEEWLALAKSHTGERGIFNRGSLAMQIPKRRKRILGQKILKLGTNPCGEILLQPKQFCNLSEVVARADDTEETLHEKDPHRGDPRHLSVHADEFPVSFEGLEAQLREGAPARRFHHGAVGLPGGAERSGAYRCSAIARVAVNKEYAKRFGVTPSTSVTCVKPSGTVSQTVDAASGLHARHAQYYIRRVRISATDALFHMMKDQKVPYFPEVGQSISSASTFVFEFPVKAPEGAVLKDDLSRDRPAGILAQGEGELYRT